MSRDERKWLLPEALEPVQIATAMYKLHPFCTIKTCDGLLNDKSRLLCMYCDSGEREGLYVDSDRVLSALANQFKYTLAKREREEIIFHLKTLVPEKSRTMDPGLIAVNNGIFDYRTKMLFHFLMYRSAEADVAVNVVIKDETVWLTQKVMAELFDVDKFTISRHLKNIFQEDELNEKVVVAKIATTTPHGAIAGKTQTTDMRHLTRPRPLPPTLTGK